MDRFNRISPDRDDWAPRPRKTKDKNHRGGAKNYTHEFTTEYEKAELHSDPKETQEAKSE